MRKLIIAAASAAALLALTGCSSDEHKGETCVQSHDESVLMPVTNYVGKVPVTTYIPVTQTVCDKWVKNSA